MKPTIPDYTPFHFRASYEWILTFGVPYIAVYGPAITDPVLESYKTKDGQLILNISPKSITHYHEGEEYLSFKARFSGRTVDLDIPYSCILAIYDRDTGAGQVLSTPEIASKSLGTTEPVKPARPTLRLV